MQMIARLRRGQLRGTVCRAEWAKQKRPGKTGAFKSRKALQVLRTPGIDLAVIALGVPLVHDIVELLDVAFGIELHLAAHGIAGAGLERVHYFLRFGGSAL